MRRSTSRAPRGSRLLLVVLSALVLLPGLLALTPLLAGASEPRRTTTHPPAAPAAPASHAGRTARTVAADNPLADRPWGVYQGSAELAWPPYAAATGAERDVLGRIALRPKAKWFGAWIPDDQIATRARDYIDATLASTGGDPETLVQLTVFRMVPWEHEACTRLPTAEESASYRTWMANLAFAIGSTHTAIVLQPDGPFALCAPGGSTAYPDLIAGAVATLSALPNTSVYVGAGAADWFRMKPARAVRLLVADGIAQARGFALNTTHYDSTARNIRFGAEVVAGLDRLGITGKHLTIDTASNGRAFTGARWRRAGRPGGRFDNATPCTAPGQRVCVSLGIPPTWHTDDPRWGLPERVRLLAAQHVDAYLWAGRPWLTNATSPFDRARALDVATSSPYADVPVEQPVGAPAG